MWIVHNIVKSLKLWNQVHGNIKCHISYNPIISDWESSAGEIPSHYHAVLLHVSVVYTSATSSGVKEDSSLSDKENSSSSDSFSSK